jgi:hypothetical protein
MMRSVTSAGGLRSMGTSQMGFDSTVLEREKRQLEKIKAKQVKRI